MNAKLTNRNIGDDELRATCLAALTGCPDFIAKVTLNDEECTAAASAISDGDMAELGRLFLAAIEREASERISVKAEECGITAGEAAERLWKTYRPEEGGRITITRGFGLRYDPQTGAIRDFYVRDGVRRWVDTDEPCPDQILKGNADLVPPEHQTMGGEA